MGRLAHHVERGRTERTGTDRDPRARNGTERRTLKNHIKTIVNLTISHDAGIPFSGCLEMKATGPRIAPLQEMYAVQSRKSPVDGA